MRIIFLGLFTTMFLLFVWALYWLASMSLVYFFYTAIVWEAMMLSYRSTWKYLVEQEFDLSSPIKPVELSALLLVSTLGMPFIPYLSFIELIKKD